MLTIKQLSETRLKKGKNGRILKEGMKEKIARVSLELSPKELQTDEHLVDQQLQEMADRKKHLQLLNFQLLTTPEKVNEFILNKYSEGRFNLAERDGYDNSEKRKKAGLIYEYHVYFDELENYKDQKTDLKYVVTKPLTDTNGDTYYYHIPIHRNEKGFTTDYGEQVNSSGHSLTKNGLVHALNSISNSSKNHQTVIDGTTYDILDEYSFIKDGQIQYDVRGVTVEKYFKASRPLFEHSSRKYLERDVEKKEEEVEKKEEEVEKKEEKKEESEEVFMEPENDQDVIESPGDEIVPPIKIKKPKQKIVKVVKVVKKKGTEKKKVDPNKKLSEIGETFQKLSAEYERLQGERANVAEEYEVDKSKENEERLKILDKLIRESEAKANDLVIEIKQLEEKIKEEKKEEIKEEKKEEKKEEIKEEKKEEPKKKRQKKVAEPTDRKTRSATQKENEEKEKEEEIIERPFQNLTDEQLEKAEKDVDQKLAEAWNDKKSFWYNVKQNNIPVTYFIAKSDTVVVDYTKAVPVAVDNKLYAVLFRGAGTGKLKLQDREALAVKLFDELKPLILYKKELKIEPNEVYNSFLEKYEVNELISMNDSGKIKDKWFAQGSKKQKELIEKIIG